MEKNSNSSKGHKSTIMSDNETTSQNAPILKEALKLKSCSKPHKSEELPKHGDTDYPDASDEANVIVKKEICDDASESLEKEVDKVRQTRRGTKPLKDSTSDVKTYPQKKKTEKAVSRVSNLAVDTDASCSNNPLPSGETNTEKTTSTKSSVNKPRKRRHFRGGTYGLYLTKKKRKKKQPLDLTKTKLKEDESSQAGTENSSFLDSEESCNFSEGLYTPSEKSLADDESSSALRSSPILTSDSKMSSTDSKICSEKHDRAQTDATEKKDNSKEFNKQMFEIKRPWEMGSPKHESTPVHKSQPHSQSTDYEDISSENLSNTSNCSFKEAVDDMAPEDLRLPQTSARTEETKESCDAAEESDATDEVLDVSDPNQGTHGSSTEHEDTNQDEKMDDSSLEKSENTASTCDETKMDKEVSRSMENDEESEISSDGYRSSEDLHSDELTYDPIITYDAKNLDEKAELKGEISADALKEHCTCDHSHDEHEEEVHGDEMDDVGSERIEGSTHSDMTNETCCTSDEPPEENELESPCDKDADAVHSDMPSDNLPSADGHEIYIDEDGCNKNYLESTSDKGECTDISSDGYRSSEDLHSDELSYEPITEEYSQNKAPNADGEEVAHSCEEIQIDELSCEAIADKCSDKDKNSASGDGIQESSDVINESFNTNDEIQGEVEMMEEDAPKDDADDHLKDLDEETEATIATFVKTRQRMKRRFTDDVVDTDVGILSLNAMSGSRRLPPKVDVHKETVESFLSTSKEAKMGPIAKLECIFNSRQKPIKNCTCTNAPLEASIGEDTIYCQAVDTVHGKTIGCANRISLSLLVRSSVKMPFTVMCETHIARLMNHHCCPYCGHFCTQGSFMLCAKTENNHPVYHLYHEKCQMKDENSEYFCFHCGETSGLKVVEIGIRAENIPACYLNQKHGDYKPNARISFKSSKKHKKQDDESFRLKNSDKTISLACVPIGVCKEDLDMLIDNIKNDQSEPILYTEDQFYYAAAEGDNFGVFKMLSQGIDPNVRFPENDNDTALHVAANAGHVLVVDLLCQAGAIIDILNEIMYTPLMLAADNNQMDAAGYLVAAGALVDFKGDTGMTALHVAAKCGGLSTMSVLTSGRKIDIDIQDDGGWTPLVWASEHSHLDVARFLLEKGANPNLRDNEGNVALHWSAYAGSVGISLLYLDYGCDVNSINEHGDTPLHVAARQGNSECVHLLLMRGADSSIINKADQLPEDCCVDADSQAYALLNVNSQLKKSMVRCVSKTDKILHRDVSLGKEQIAIPCINELDDETVPTDYLYVTENCETMPINIDRSISSLQSCKCEDDCSTTKCVCARISFKCWYDRDGCLLPDFNMSDPPMLFECNRACLCWNLNCRNRVLQNGIRCRLQLIRTRSKGWGVRTMKEVPKGTFICEYVGEIISDLEADKRKDDSYLFDLDNRDGETYCLDARYYGNISRFINHLCEPNLVPVKIFVDHQDLSFPRIAFFSSRDIKQYEELGFDYGEKFWIIKSKHFTCDCGTLKCKYSNDTIQETLANYKRRIREEQVDEQSRLLVSEDDDDDIDVVTPEVIEI